MQSQGSHREKHSTTPYARGLRRGFGAWCHDVLRVSGSDEQEQRSGCATYVSRVSRPKQKFNQTKEALEHIGKIKISSINQIIKSPKIFEYRNKMEFSFSNNRWLISSEKNDKNKNKKEFPLG